MIMPYRLKYLHNTSGIANTKRKYKFRSVFMGEAQYKRPTGDAAERAVRGIIEPARPVYILGSSAVVGREEYKGPLGEYFDVRDGKDDSFGMKSWEMAESEMQRLALNGVLAGAKFGADAVGFLFAGDLQNQCVGSNYGLLNFNIPYLGLYGACSTAAEGIMLASIVSGATGRLAAAVSSSHNCSAERQFRFPMEYGGQRTPTAQWTVTGAGAFVVGTDPSMTKYDAAHVRVADVMPGIAQDRGITDINNMGAAMAPAAADTFLRYFKDTDTVPEDYDLIITGDLGREGSGILLELLSAEGYDMIGVHKDCGLLIYGDDTDKHAGGSGCGCSAVVMAAHILEQMRRGIYKNVLFMGTGALMNPVVLNQGKSIPGIGHIVHMIAEQRRENSEE